jgi:hypothetical protein
MHAFSADGNSSSDDIGRWSKRTACKVPGDHGLSHGHGELEDVW